MLVNSNKTKNVIEHESDCATNYDWRKRNGPHRLRERKNWKSENVPRLSILQH